MAAAAAILFDGQCKHCFATSIMRLGQLNRYLRLFGRLARTAADRVLLPSAC
jgi:hypothetical protein